MRPFIAAASLLLLSGCSSLTASLPFMGSSTRANTAQEAPAMAPGQPQALYLDLISGLRDRGLHRAVIAHLDEYERLHSRTPATILMRGQALLEIRDDAAAVAVLQGISRGGELAAARAGIGLAAARGGRWDEAVAAFTEAARQEPTNARHLNNLGYALLRQGLAGQSESRLRMAGELDPASAEIRNNLAMLLLATNRGPEAEPLLAGMPSPAARDALRREAGQIRNGLEGRT